MRVTVASARMYIGTFVSDSSERETQRVTKGHRPKDSERKRVGSCESAAGCDQSISKVPKPANFRRGRQKRPSLFHLRHVRNPRNSPREIGHVPTPILISSGFTRKPRVWPKVPPESADTGDGINRQDPSLRGVQSFVKSCRLTESDSHSCAWNRCFLLVVH